MTASERAARKLNAEAHAVFTVWRRGTGRSHKVRNGLWIHPTGMSPDRWVVCDGSGNGLALFRRIKDARAACTGQLVK